MFIGYNISIKLNTKKGIKYALYIVNIFKSVRTACIENGFDPFEFVLRLGAVNDTVTLLLQQKNIACTVALHLIVPQHLNVGKVSLKTAKVQTLSHIRSKRFVRVERRVEQYSFKPVALAEIESVIPS